MQEKANVKRLWVANPRYSIRPSTLLFLISVMSLALLLLPQSGWSAIECDQAPVPEAYNGYESCPNGLTLTIDERFDSFDSTLWERSTGGFPDNSCRFIDDQEHVRIDNGQLHFFMEHKEVPGSYSRHELKDVADKSCASGELRTIKPFGPYGRLQARMKSPLSSGFVQSLFFFHFYKNPWQEIDIELQGRLPESVGTNIITNHAADYHECDRYNCTINSEEHAELPFKHSDDWHVYTIDWLPDVVRFYVDGRLIREMPKYVVEKSGGNYPNIPATILMNFWLPNPKISQYFGGNWSYDQLPLIARYDWVRFYELDEQPTKCYYRGQCPYQKKKGT